MTFSDREVFGVFRVGDRLVGVPIDNLVEVCSVPAVSRLMTAKGPILGAFDLRGNMVPLVDSLALVEAGEFERAVKEAALIQYDGRLVAIALDEVINLFEATPVVPISRQDASRDGSVKPQDANHTMFAGGFVMDGAIVSCLDAAALLRETSQFAVAQSRQSARRTETSHRNKYLVFASGGAKFAVETERIWGTVPKGRLDRQNMPVDAGLFLGFIHHIGARVPVADTNMVLGIGLSSRSEETEVVVIRLSEEKLIGLHVDATERVMSIGQDEKKGTSTLLNRNELLKEVFVDQDDTQIFIVDHEVLSKHSEVTTVSNLVSSPTAGETDQEQDRGATAEISRDQMSYLVFEAGHRRAVPAQQILRIIKKPKKVVSSGSVPPEVQGFFAHGNRSVPIVSLNDNVTDEIADYVLIVSHEGEQIGFMANEICGVRFPERKIESAGGPDVEPTLIQFKEQGENRLVPLVDLQLVASSLLSGIDV